MLFYPQFTTVSFKPCLEKKWRDILFFRFEILQSQFLNKSYLQINVAEAKKEIYRN